MTHAASHDGNTKLVTSLFKDRDSVERAYQAVLQRGYDADDINALMSEDTRRRYFSGNSQIDAKLGSKAAEGGELGGPAGGRVGMIIPVIIAAGVVALPGLGLVAVGPITVALASAATAGAAFGLIAALSDWGIPKERAQEYDTGIRRGAILLGIKARTDEDARYFEEQWEAVGGQCAHA